MSSYCYDIVKNRDKIGYLSSRLILPKSMQRPIISIRALNIELSSAKDSLNNNGNSLSSSNSNYSAGTMKLQWWKDAINALYEVKSKDKPSLSIRLFQNHPIMKEMIELQIQNYMDKSRIINMINSRIEDINSENVFEDLDSMETYAENTSSSLFYLSLDTLRIPRDYNSSIYRAASHAGVAIGITSALRGLPYLISKGEIRLPKNDMIAHRLSKDDIMESFLVLSPNIVTNTLNKNKNQNVTEKQNEKAKAVIDLIYHVASQAHGHMKKSHEIEKDIPYNQRRVLLPLVATRLYLEKLEKYNFNVFHEDLLKYSSSQYAILPFHLYYNALKGSY